MKQISITVNAGEAQNLSITGQFISVRSSNGPLRFKFASYDVVLAQGQKTRFPESFSIVEVVNNSAAAITADLVVGLGDYDDREVSGTVSLSSGGIATTADISVPNAAATLLIAANSARREIVIQSDPANVANIRIGDASVGAAQGLILAPGGSASLETSGAAYAYHAAGIAQTLQILEVF